MPVKDGVIRTLDKRPSAPRPVRRRRKIISVKPRQKIVVEPNIGVPIHEQIEHLIGE